LLYGAKPPAGVTYSAGKHPGIDLVGVSDKLIRAVRPGCVYRSGYDLSGWGKYTVVKQDDGLYAIYAHMSKAYKSVGQQVKAGETLGVEGSTGKATGSHLHFELRRAYPDKYSTIDPAGYLGIQNKIGMAKVVDEIEKQITIVLNGKNKIVNAIEKDGHNYVMLQDLRDDKIAIGYKGGKPTIDSK
jgi:hypothetical protein